ncbi:MAG: hypothetical protein MI919_17925, partial [Holophagales bacterium]|nr:hypothetical protein [Holophagales bacterium]
GLMTGLSGVGYGLLRLAKPDSVPSVLAVDPVPGDERASDASRRPGPGSAVQGRTVPPPITDSPRKDEVT